MQNECGNHRQEIRQQLVNFLPSDVCEKRRHQAEDADGGKLNQHGDQLHHELVEVFKESSDPLTSRTAAAERDADQQGEHNDLQHVAFRHRRYRITREDVHQRVFDAGRFVDLESSGLDAVASTFARTDDERQHQRYGDCNRGGQQIQPNRFETDPPHVAVTTKACCATDQRHEYQRDHHEHQAADKDVAAGVEQAVYDERPQEVIGGHTRPLDEQSQHQAGRHSDEYPDGQVHAEAPFEFLSANFNHFEIFFAHTTFGADEIFRDVLPLGARRDVFLFAAFGFVIDPAADYALPFLHSSLRPSSSPSSRPS